MKQLQEKLKELWTNVKSFVVRFPLSTFYIALISLFVIYMIISEEDCINLVLSSTVGGLLTFLLELSYEYQIHKIKLLSFLSVPFSVFVFLLLKAYENIYVYTAAFGMAIAIVSLVAFVLYLKRDKRGLLSHLVKSAFIVNVFSGIVLSGVGVCIAALYFLIYSFEDVWKIYTIASVLIGGTFSIILFLSFVPSPDKEIEIPSVYKTIIHKALFYIYLALIGILYLYIVKIVVTWKMPVGRLNWFGCFALLFYVFFYLTVDEEDGKIQELFKKWGTLLLTPIVAIQIFAIVIRVSAYGLTLLRFLSIILIIAALGFMVLAVLRKNVAWGFLFVSILTLLFTCTNFNIYDVPNREQEVRLKNALSAGGALVNGKLDTSVEMETEYLENAKSAYDYLRYSPGNKSDFFNDAEEKEIYTMFNYYDYNPERNIRYIDYYQSDDERTLDVSEYKTLIFVNQYSTVMENIYLEDFILSYNWDTWKQGDELPKYELNDGRTLIFTSLSCEYDIDAKNIQYLYYEAYLLEK